MIAKGFELTYFREKRNMKARTVLCVAAIDAITIAGPAQSNVYSSNIVGYAVVGIPPGYSLLANPLSAGTSNGANEIMPILDGEMILTWNGLGFTQVGYDSGFGGWVGADAKRGHSHLNSIRGQDFFSSTPTRQRQILHS